MSCFDNCQLFLRHYRYHTQKWPRDNDGQSTASADTNTTNTATNHSNTKYSKYCPPLNYQYHQPEQNPYLVLVGTESLCCFSFTFTRTSSCDNLLLRLGNDVLLHLTFNTGDYNDHECEEYMATIYNNSLLLMMMRGMMPKPQQQSNTIYRRESTNKRKADGITTTMQQSTTKKTIEEPGWRLKE